MSDETLFGLFITGSFVSLFSFGLALILFGWVGVFLLMAVFVYILKKWGRIALCYITDDPGNLGAVGEEERDTDKILSSSYCSWCGKHTDYSKSIMGEYNTRTGKGHIGFVILECPQYKDGKDWAARQHDRHKVALVREGWKEQDIIKLTEGATNEQ